MERPRGPMLVAIVVCVLLGLAAWMWLGDSPPAQPTVGRDAAVTTPGAAGGSPAATGPGGDRDAGGFRPPVATVRDRAVRDEVRQRILAAWLGALPTVDAASDGGAGAYLSMPVLDGGSVDPEYLRERIREDFLPMARACYDQLLARRPGVGGRTVAEFVIVGDERVGGVVDEVGVKPEDGGLGDSAFATCLIESMYTMAFRPPPGRGSLRVRYPFRFAPDSPDAAP